MIKTVIGAAMINLDDALECTEDVATFDEFDEEVNSLINDGWTLDKRYTIGKKSLYFVAELSREEEIEGQAPTACQNCYFYRPYYDVKCRAVKASFNIPFHCPPPGCPRKDEFYGVDSANNQDE